MAMVTEVALIDMTQIFANAGLSDEWQYLPRSSVIMAVKVQIIRIRQYWKMEIQTIYGELAFSYSL